MFVYNYMSGIIGNLMGTSGSGETGVQEEDEESFDPHKHRIIAKPTSYADTMVHFLKGSIGAGMLAMPEAIRRVGIIFGVIGLTALAAFCVYCLDMLISVQYRLCKRWRRGYIAYPKSMRLALQDGPMMFRTFANPLATFVDTVLIIWQLGICTIYLIFVAENIKQVLEFYGVVYSIRMFLLFQLVPAILLNLIRDLKLLAPISSLSNGITLFAILLVFFYLVEDDISIKPEMFKLKDFEDIALFLGTALFAMEAVGVMLALEYNMENPKDFLGKFGLLNIAMTIIVSLYLVVGVSGYVKYGDNIKASITLNLPQNEKKAQCAKVFFATAIFLSFPLQNFVAYSMLWRKLKKEIQRKRRNVNPVYADYFLRVLLVILPWLLAVLVPKLGPFISLFGAFCLSLLAIVFPAIMDTCWWFSSPQGFGKYRYRLLRNIGIILVGAICLFSGVLVSLMEMAHND